MTLSPPSSSSVGISKRATRVSFNDHPETIERISSNYEGDVDSNLSLDRQSCFTTLNKWWQDIYRRIKRSDNENNQQQTDIEPKEVNTNESIRRNTIIKNFRRTTIRRQRKLFPLKSPYRTIKITDKSSVSIACSEQYILLKQTPNLCLLDKQLNIIQEIPWTYDHVEICWSSTLNQFILITERIIFTLDENTKILNQCSIYIDNDKEWSCGACSDTSLYLSTGDMSASLHQYTLQPTIEFIKEWQLFPTYPKYEGILTFTCANGKIALIISNVHSFQRCFDIRSSITLERLWSIRLDAVAHCCSINNNEWIIMELLEPRLLHLSSDGEILQEYKVKTSSMDVIWNAIQLDSDTIITFTMKNLNLHRINFSLKDIQS